MVIKNHGIEAVVMAQMPIRLIRHVKKKLTDDGRVSSILLISQEITLRIRPCGVVSK